MPNVVTAPVSGSRSGFARSRPVTWPFGCSKLPSVGTPTQARARFGFAAMRAVVRPTQGSVNVDELLAGDAYRSRIVGARNTCAYVPLSRMSSIGRYSSLTVEFVVLSKSE